MWASSRGMAADVGASGSGGVAVDCDLGSRLTEEEADVFALIMDVVKGKGLAVTPRVAGGWVRDKLMGKESKDLDVALDTMMGVEFAEHLNDVLAARGHRTHSVGEIRVNPEKSKHLETATVRVGELEMDVVNLRSESYAEGSRIPEAMAFGTAEEDALRRDLTINALFYNLVTGEVEDLTGRGLADLRAGLCRAPMADQRQTLLDDPLRALRAVRFAARFRFALDGDLADACRDPDVLTALRDKVSRERVGAELNGMLKHDPPRALAALAALGMFDAVATLPDGMDAPDGGAADPRSLAADCVFGMLVALEVAASAGIAPPASSAEGRLLHLAGFFSPLAGRTYPAKKNKPRPAAEFVIKESLKLRGKDSDAVCALHRAAAASFDRLLDQVQGVGGEGGPTRVQLGLALREAGAEWRVALALAAARRVRQSTVFDPSSLLRPDIVTDGEVIPGGGLDGEDEVAAMARARGSLPAEEMAREASGARKVADLVADMGLDECWELKPLLNGEEVMRALGRTRGGPWLGSVTPQLLAWQLERPHGSKDECAAWLAAEVGPSLPPP